MTKFKIHFKQNKLNVLKDVEKFLENPDDFPAIQNALTLHDMFGKNTDEDKVAALVAEKQDWNFFHAKHVIEILKTFE